MFDKIVPKMNFYGDKNVYRVLRIESHSTCFPGELQVNVMSVGPHVETVTLSGICLITSLIFVAFVLKQATRVVTSFKPF